MKKDIPNLKVEALAICVVPPDDNPHPDPVDGENLWDVFLVNLKKDAIHNVLIRSKGYGRIEGDEHKTTTLRHFFEHVPAETAVLIEPIQQKVFDLANEYWISFTYEGYMYDKKYIFVRGSITSRYFTRLPIIDRQGVMIL